MSHLNTTIYAFGVSQVVLMVKNLLANAGDIKRRQRDVGSIPGSGRSPEEDMATYSSILAWRIPWTQESYNGPYGWLRFIWSKGADCRSVWSWLWARVHRVAKSRTWLKLFNTEQQVVLMVNNLPANAGDSRVVGSILESGGSPGEWNGNPHQYSCLENSMGRGASHATVHEATESRTWLSVHIYFYYFF